MRTKTSIEVVRGRARRALIAASVGIVGAPIASEAAWASPPADPPVEAGEEAGTVTKRFALVVGTNVARERGQSPLRFADDDAARVATLLEETGAEVSLLTTFDQDSQRLFPELVSRARRPSPANLERAAAEIEKKVAAARKAGQRAELLIYFSGHGDVGPDGQGFLNLEGGKLTRSDLFGGLVSGSSADKKHVLVDACRSEELVLSRGEDDWKPDRAGADDANEVRAYLERTQLKGHPDTGVVIATSVDQRTHEWERYRGGIFTHQLLSGLRGGADLNGDGALEYSEIGAFVSSANSGVGDPRARLEVVVRPPSEDQRAPLLVHEEVAAQRVVMFVGRDSRRYVVEDQRGIRLADLRRDGSRPAYLRLPPSGPVFVYRHGAPTTAPEEAKIDPGATGVVLASSLEFVEAERVSRGALDEAFRQGLFSVPYGLGYYAGYTDREDLVGVADPEWEVRVWQRVDGELVEVARVTGDDEGGEGVPSASAPPSAEGPEPPPPAPPDEAWGDWDDDEVHHQYRQRTWGSFQFGTEFSPFDPGGQISQHPWRVISNEFSGFGSDPGLRSLRGFDARWSVFKAAGPFDFPVAEGFFRTGYTQGFADFLPDDELVGFEMDQATRLEYFTVPLFVGGHLFVPFRRFPVRPYAGAGFGFDVLALDYSRFQRGPREDVSARIGFELHAGLDIRLTNYFSLVGELRQLWSARRKLSGLPDYSNEGLTIVTALRVGIPMGRKARDDARAQHRRRRGRSHDSSAPTSPAKVAAPVEAWPEAGASSPGEEAVESPEEPRAPDAEGAATPAEGALAEPPPEATAPAPAPAVVEDDR